MYYGPQRSYYTLQETRCDGTGGVAACGEMGVDEREGGVSCEGRDDEEGDVSDGRGVESVSGARGPGARRWGGRRGGGGGAPGPPRARAMRKKRPARASTRRAVNAARAVATGAAAAPAAGASMPPRWAAGGGSAGRARAREGLGMGRHLGGPQKVSRSLGFPPAERGGGVVRSGGKQGANILGQGARGELEENAMRARAGRWAAHRRGGVDADTRSLYL